MKNPCKSCVDRFCKIEGFNFACCEKRHDYNKFAELFFARSVIRKCSCGRPKPEINASEVDGTEPIEEREAKILHKSFHVECNCGIKTKSYAYGHDGKIKALKEWNKGNVVL